MDLIKAIKTRKSVREFSTIKKPNWRDIIECIETARYAPAAGNIFTLKFILVDDKEKINKISEHSQQDFIRNAPYILIVCSIPTMLEKNFPDKYKDYEKQQAGAAMQNILLSLNSKGLSTCWIGAFAEQLIKKEFEIPDKATIEAIFPIGYEKKTNKQTKSPKGDIDAMLYFNKYKNKKMQKI